MKYNTTDYYPVPSHEANKFFLSLNWLRMQIESFTRVSCKRNSNAEIFENTLANDTL